MTNSAAGSWKRLHYDSVYMEHLLRSIKHGVDTQQTRMALRRVLAQPRHLLVCEQNPLTIMQNHPCPARPSQGP